MQYLGESSRSAYQCGAEHQKEIKEGLMTHPVVLHFWEGYQGEEQEVLMRVTSSYEKT